MIVGVFIGITVIIYLNNGYVKRLKANNNIPVPEWRMPITMVGGVLFSGGLFWLGWGGYEGNEVRSFVTGKTISGQNTNTTSVMNRSIGSSRLLLGCSWVSASTPSSCNV